MNNIEFYKELIEKLSNQIIELEISNRELREELSFCKGKVEILSAFYSDFQHHIDGDNISKHVTTDNELPKNNYGALVTHYLTTHDLTTLENLFENHPQEIRKILTNLRNHLSSDMQMLVEKHGFTEEYEIIKKCVVNIENLENDSPNAEKGMVEIIDNYIKNFNADKRNTAIRYMKHALIYYPLLFDEVFLEKTRKYQYDDSQDVIRDLKIKYYGENNMLLPKNTEKPTSKKKSGENGVKSPNGSGKRFDYNVVEIPTVVEYVKNSVNKRQRALSCYDKLVKYERSDEDILEFIESVNSFLRKKI